MVWDGGGGRSTVRIDWTTAVVTVSGMTAVRWYADELSRPDLLNKHTAIHRKPIIGKPGPWRFRTPRDRRRGWRT